MTQTPTNSVERLSAPISRLMFSHYSQLDPEWGFEIGTERSMCGLVCVKSIIDHYNNKSGFDIPHISTLLDAVKAADDNKPNGISHAVEVELLKAQGLVAWRRNWDAPSSDSSWLINNEHYSDEQANALDTQQLEELAFDTIHDRELLSINDALSGENPVITSMKGGFGGNTRDHQVVIVGREFTDDGETFIIMDPEHKPGSTLHAEPIERFFEYFNNRAIFVKQ